ncbi:MAG: IS200/IS605 family transposase [Paludibacteraceae bacterium]|nr:IS200/IS605 family transposase [Paludibacteraceae bacterium]
MSHICLTYHIVWRTKCSKRSINEAHERDLFAYIFGICKEKKCTLYRVNAMQDHVHMCIEIHPTIALSDFMKALKQSTSSWMKEHKEMFPFFDSWGNGYAAFTYAVKDRPNVINYIRNQKEHHKTFDFREEYESLLIEFGLDPKTDKFLED